MAVFGVEKPRVRKRQRVVLVCNACKVKKIKCDKEMPCGSCVKHGWKCEYPPLPLMLTESDTEAPNNLAGYIGEGRDSTILDKQLTSFQHVTIICKPGKTVATSFALQGPAIKCLMEFKHVLHTKRMNWKKSHRKVQLSLNEVYVKDPNGLHNIIEEINQCVTPNYFAFIERIRHFQVRLNKLIFGSCVPGDLLFTIFHRFFKYQNNQFIFVPPLKDYQYQGLALLFAIVDITIIFTDPDSSIVFEHPLESNEDQLSHLALKCINHSRHDKKQTVIGLYAILAVRSSLWIYGSNQNSSMENHNAYPMFQKAVTLALSIGLHRLGTNVQYLDFSKSQLEEDVYYTSEIPMSCLKRLWNYIMHIDAKYGTTGTPMYIDLDFCHGYHRDPFQPGTEREECILLTRKVAETLFSVKAATYNDLYKLCEEIKDVAGTLTPIDEVIRYKDRPNGWASINMKLDTLKLLILVSGYGCKVTEEKLLERAFTPEQLQNTENYLIITEYHNYMLQTFFMTYILVLKYISDTIDADYHVEFYLAIQDLFRNWFSRPTLTAIDFLLVEEAKQKEFDKPSIQPTVKIMEDALLGKLNNKNMFKSVVNYSTDPKSVFEEVSRTYKKLFRLPCYQNNYNFLIFSMICWVLIYFIKALLELRNFPLMGFKERMAKLVELTKVELDCHNNELKNDGLNMIQIENLLNDEIEMDSLLHTFFGQEPYLSPPRDFISYFSQD